MSFLNGIKVVDLSQMVSGPVATMHLGDMGANVVKVERPESGDISRNLAPFVDGVSSQFVALNRNKRSIEVDLRSDRGQRLVMELLEEADVFVENYKAGTAEGSASITTPCRRRTRRSSTVRSRGSHRIRFTRTTPRTTWWHRR